MKPTVNRAFICNWLKESTEEVMNQLHDSWPDYDDWQSVVFEHVDLTWTHFGFDGGSIADWDEVSDVDDMQRIAEILRWGKEERCIETDEGCWQGVHPVAALGTQAFMTLEAGLTFSVEKELDTWEAEHDCDECKGGKCSKCKYNLLWEYEEPCEDEDDD